MTDAPPPGWYPNPAGGAAPRWWTGRDWAASAPAGPVVVAQPPLPAGTSTNTVWIWLQAVLPLLTVLTQLPYLTSFSSLIDAQLELQRQATEHGLPYRSALPTSAVTDLLTGFALSAALNLLVGAAWVLFALLDERALRGRGLVQPFSWGWSFLSVVYPIGRAVVVRRRTRGGLAPLFVLIGTFVVANVAVVAVFFTVVLGTAARIPSTTPVSGA